MGRRGLRYDPPVHNSQPHKRQVFPRGPFIVAQSFCIRMHDDANITLGPMRLFQPCSTTPPSVCYIGRRLRWLKYSKHDSHRVASTNILYIPKATFNRRPRLMSLPRGKC